MRRIAGMAAVISVVAGCRSGPLDEGAVNFGGDVPQSWAYITADPGQSITFGEPIISNSGDRDAVLTSASLEPSGDASGVTVAAARLVDLRRHPGSTVGVDYGYPSKHLPGPTVSLHNWTMPTSGQRRGAELVFRVTVRRPGTWRFSGVQLHYRVGSRNYTTSTSMGLRVCAPSGADCTRD